MKNKVLYFVAYLMLVPWSTFGQDNLYFNRSLQDFASKMQLSGSEGGYRMSGGSKSTVEGSEYLNEKFVKGEIFTSDSERFTDIPMRFNAYHDEVEVLMPDTTIWTLTNKSNIIKIHLNSSVLVYTGFISDEGNKSGYLSLIYSGKNLLYRRDYKVFMEGVPSNGIINEIPSKIVDRQKEFFIKTDAGLPRFFKTYKGLSEISGTQSSEIKSFIKKNKINLKKEDDLIKLMTYIDTIN
jgi:hypothetical protein